MHHVDGFGLLSGSQAGELFKYGDERAGLQERVAGGILQVLLDLGGGRATLRGGAFGNGRGPGLAPAGGLRGLRGERERGCGQAECGDRARTASHRQYQSSVCAGVLSWGGTGNVR